MKFIDGGEWQRIFALELIFKWDSNSNLNWLIRLPTINAIYLYHKSTENTFDSNAFPNVPPNCHCRRLMFAAIATLLNFWMSFIKWLRIWFYSLVCIVHIRLPSQANAVPNVSLSAAAAAENRLSLSLFGESYSNFKAFHYSFVHGQRLLPIPSFYVSFTSNFVAYPIGFECLVGKKEYFDWENLVRLHSHWYVKHKYTHIWHETRHLHTLTYDFA